MEENLGEVAKTVQLHPSIETLVRLAPLLGEIFPDDVTIGVCDVDTLWATVPGKTFSLGLNPGYKLVPGDGMYEAVHYGKPTKTLVPKEVFGVPILACSIPVHDIEGNVIGAIGAGASMERYDYLSSLATTLSSSIEQISATIEELAGSVNILSDNMTDIFTQSSEVLDSIQEIQKISNTVRQISDSTKVLGLNASIEAARSGEYGKGFAVIAQEVRKLATDAKNQTDGITQSVHDIEQLIRKLSESISTVNQETENQSAATQQFAATMQELAQNAADLAKYAEGIVSGEQ
ncbi:putative sensory transducer protein YfmS [Alicyclobacillus acidoterrestris]|uniref:methyl-accepting chemotaxis protein n=1 Tax=Alicyclobacillus suci TaxID=2816080 RepID=UPI00119139EC|nr:methyl-accepting chemotaxis protein [Alicyclobacillus suci]GEO25117.1 putative sensory transducer protein YfmS [Alicyclobacillus acidoterrestris]